MSLICLFQTREVLHKVRAGELASVQKSAMEKLDLMILQKKSSDFGDSEAFMVPVIKAFGSKPVFRFYGDIDDGWDWDKISREIGPSILRSSTEFCEESSMLKREALIDLGDTVFIQLGMFSIIALATTRDTANKASEAFIARFAKPSAPIGPRYQIIVKGCMGFETLEVKMDPSRISTFADLDLLYGEGFAEWLARFESRLFGRKGLYILEGAPGTGKTNCIRHLISRLAKTHRFYFIPSIFGSTISSPDFVPFWESERRRYPNLHFVCVFEDAEASLMKRGLDNRHKVEAVLNITDGLLADFLRIHVVCTINCKSEEIDAALMRPGRLIAHRVFARHEAHTAQKIAEKFGRGLKVRRHNYSLAEIFNENELSEKPALIGFQPELTR